MIVSLESGSPKTTGISFDATPDYVELNVPTNLRKYISIINTTAGEIEVAIGRSQPQNADYITIGTKGYLEIAHPEFFRSVDIINIWFKASGAATAVIIH